MTTKEFLKYYDTKDPWNYVQYMDVEDDDGTSVYKYGVIEILSTAKKLLEDKDKRIKELKDMLIDFFTTLSPSKKVLDGVKK